MAKILLNAKLDVNIRDTLGLTPLLIACGKPIAGYRGPAAIKIGELLLSRRAVE